MLRTFLLLLVGAVGLVGAPGSARAAARVLAPADETVGISEVRVAVALGPEQTALWLSLGLKGPARRALVVLPAPAGSALDTASEAWLNALETCSAPRILAPYGELPSCGGANLERLEDTSELDAGDPLAPSQVSVLSSVLALTDLARGRGFSLDNDDLAALAPSTSFIAVELDIPVGGGRTPSLRLVMPGANPALALGLLREGAGAPFTLFVIGAARTKLSGARELEPEALAPAWHVFASMSDYAERRRARLQTDDGQSFVLEAAGNDPLFSFRLLPDALATIEPAASSYFSRAAGLDEIVRDSEDCVAAVNEARAKKARVGKACAPGVLGRVGDDACQETPIAGEIDPNVLRCDRAEDFAFALSGLRADEAVLTRFRGWTGSSSFALEASGGSDRAPVVRAKTLVTSGCQPSASGGSGSGGRPAGGSGGRGGFGGFGGSSNPTEPIVVEESTSADIHCGCESTSSGDSCSGSGSGEDESCSGDTSEEDDGCSSDSGTEDDGCGSDGAGEGDGCSGDGADEGGGDCSGDASGESDCAGGSEGGDCSGDAGGGGGECTMLRSRARPRVSALTLALFSILLPMRRWTRRAKR